VHLNSAESGGIRAEIVLEKESGRENKLISIRKNDQKKKKWEEITERSWVRRLDRESCVSRREFGRSNTRKRVYTSNPKTKKVRGLQEEGEK